MAVDPLAVAVYGFLPRRRVYDAAGHAYEAGQCLDRLRLGLDCSPILSHQFIAKLSRLSLSDQRTERASPDTESETDDESSLFDSENEAYTKYLMKLDPTDTKSQDHYKVLGLKKLRHEATEAQIRKAYRAKVLHHHPDKRRGRGLPVAADASEDYFTCITKAFEQIGDAIKRRAYDSCDPTFDNTVPSQSSLTADNFFDLLTPVFERNSRWSTNQPVPQLGDLDSTDSHVEHFYSFWFDFSSWREFSYLDEEDKEKGENREERRWIDKQNQKARQEHRKDEIKRIRNLVEMAYAVDPRVSRMKEAQKRHKEERKQAKKAQQQARKDQEDKERLEVEQAKREQEEREKEAEKARLEDEKRKKEAAKKRLKAQRKQLLELVEEQKSNGNQQSNQYFTSNASERISRAESVQKLLVTLDVDALQLLNQRLGDAPNGESHETILLEAVADVERELEQRSAQLTQQTRTSAAAPGAADNVKWSEDEQQLLVKASVLFPVGTKARWDVIAQFINDHRKEGHGKQKVARDIINRVKLMSQSQNTPPVAADNSSSNGLPSQLQKSKKDGESRLTAEPTMANGEQATEKPEKGQWSAEEQRLLEQALRTYNAQAPDRWDKIASCLPGRTKKDCMRRYKELAELVKSKKAAQQKVAQK